MNSISLRFRELQALALRLGIRFENIAILDRALTHASIACERKDSCKNYESLEFVGDAALGLAAAHLLFERVPERTPGEYSRMRAAIVNRRCLARIARDLDIAPAIRLGKGEELAGGRARAALLADCLEALLGALYLDQGWEAARAFAVRLLEPEVASLQARRRIWDFKSRLLHHCQARHIGLPEFVVVRSDGPDHRKEFEVEVLLRGTSAGQGVGASKKEAEQKAAHMALLREGIVFDDEEE
ncbi:MAG TPA: ribonuclease III [Candidatus Hydrogenedentes bacterium]|nr:ribonuclease III [Candidatus Hydrogenedentota bacterium]